jgi:hypothetical protein
MWLNQAARLNTCFYFLLIYNGCAHWLNLLIHWVTYQILGYWF